MVRRKNGRKSTPLPFEWHQIEGSSIFLSIILSDIFGVLFSFFSVWVGQIHHQQQQQLFSSDSKTNQLFYALHVCDTIGHSCTAVASDYSARFLLIIFIILSELFRFNLQTKKNVANR